MKILSLDGGGVFGVAQALILSQTDNTKWDLICGTSIGSAVGADIAAGGDISVDFFRQYMPRIFKKGLFTNPVWSSRYPDREINRCLKDVFKNRVLRSVKIPLLITATHIGSHYPKLFYSGCVEDGNMLLCDAVRCSCAAPTYFKPWLGYTDGGIFFNNPSIIAVSKAMVEFGAKLEDIELCSIGTGIYSRGEYNRSDHVGFWGKWLLTTLLDGGGDKTFDIIASSLPLKRYRRYQFVRGANWHLDSIENMEEAISAWSGQALYSSQQITEEFLS